MTHAELLRAVAALRGVSAKHPDCAPLLAPLHSLLCDQIVESELRRTPLPSRWGGAGPIHGGLAPVPREVAA